MKRYFTNALLLGGLAICVTAAAFADLNGKWKGKFTTGNGREIELTYLFKVDGEKLTGSITSANGELSIYDGKIKGNDFTYKVDVNETPILNVGKFYGDSTTIDVQIGDRKVHSRLLRVTQ